MIAPREQTLEEKMITEPNHPKEMMRTEYGHITFSQWLICEAFRLKCKNIDTEIVEVRGRRLVLLKK